MSFIDQNIRKVIMHEECLRPTEFIDSDSPEIQTSAQNAVEGAKTAAEKAVKLYYAVRDGGEFTS